MPSKSYGAEVFCPKCNSRMSGTCWEKVDGDENPELKNRLLDGTLFANTCTTCSHTFNVLSEFRYKANSDGVLIWFLPKHLHQQLNADEIAQRNALFKLLSESMPHVHEVHSIEEMVSLIKQYTATPTTTTTERSCKMDQNALETLLKNVTGVEEALTTIRGSLIERGLDPNDKDILYDIAVSLREMIAAAAGTSPEAKAKVVLYYDVAVSLLKEAARGDHAEAQYELGLVFYNSASFENTDYLEAANYFKRAIKNKCKYDAFHMYCKLQGKIKREQSSLYSSSANESPKVQKLRSSARMVLIFQESAMKERGLTDITQHLKFNKDLYDELKVAINNLKTNNTGGCFVATAVYGSYEAEEVRVLRQFRDLVLLRHKLTAWTVWFYYKVGPKLASVVSRSPRLRLNTKRILDRVVSLVDKYMK